jgi:ankyrin repeat protein
MKAQVSLIILGCFACLCWSGCGPSAPGIPLHQAVEKGGLKEVQQHIAAKTDLNKTDLAGWTPLHLAAMKGNLEIVKALVKAGADTQKPGKEGKTPLDVARDKGHKEVVEFLSGVGAPAQKGKSGGRRLMDGGLGVQETMDNM